MKWGKLVVCFGAAVLVSTSAAARDSSSSFKDNAGLTPQTRFVVGEITSDVEIPPNVDYKTIWPKELTERLVERKILAEPGDPNAVTIKARITQYEEGNAWARWGTFGQAMKTKLTVVATYLRNGEEIGTADAHKTVSQGGLFTINGWEYIYENVAEAIVFEAEKKMGTDD